MNLPPYPIFPDIANDRISLRQILAKDIKDLVQISFYDGVPATSVQQAEKMQAKIDQDYSDGNSIHWGIADKLTNKIVGTCGYYRGLDKGNGELGCVLLPHYRGQGFMTAALFLAIEFGLENIGLKRIWAATSLQNKDAIKLLERLNFIKVSELQTDDLVYELKMAN
jgi:[ribosomal protein S5]-alanine N-acetyltransferase